MSNLTLSKPAVYEPRWSVPNSELPFKQLRHQKSFGRVVGVESRPISEISEAAMALNAVGTLFSERHLQRDDCRGLVVASSSLSVKRGGMLEKEAEDTPDYAVLLERWSSVESVIAELNEYLSPSIDARYVRGINWGCSNFPRGVQLSCEFAQELDLQGNQFILLVTTNRLSQHMDWTELTTAIFGDYATASVISRAGVIAESRTILHAQADMRSVDGVGFSCEAADSVVGPSFTDSGVRFEMQRRQIGKLSMTSDVINTNAPTLLTEITESGLDALSLDKAAVPHWVPHQAGRVIIDRFADKAQIDPDGIVRVYQSKGNLTASSIPQALWERWKDLKKGPIACPSVGTGPVGTTSMSRGLVVLG